MRLYSDTLTTRDLYAALPAGTDIEAVSIMHPRARVYGWNVRMTKPGATRRTNSGTHGAGPDGAASWDDHGHWMSALYALDPKMRVANYDGAEDFHAQTKDAYRIPCCTKCGQDVPAETRCRNRCSTPSGPAATTVIGTEQLKSMAARRFPQDEADAIVREMLEAEGESAC